MWPGRLKYPASQWTASELGASGPLRVMNGQLGEAAAPGRRPGRDPEAAIKVRSLASPPCHAGDARDVRQA
jgi:hypothetical protein